MTRDFGLPLRLGSRPCSVPGSAQPQADRPSRPLELRLPAVHQQVENSRLEKVADATMQHSISMDQHDLQRTILTNHP